MFQAKHDRKLSEILIQFDDNYFPSNQFLSRTDYSILAFDYVENSI